MQFHEVANIFPMMNASEYESLKADIRAHGLLEPIWLHDGMIIDGRNRYQACVELGVEPTYRKWDGNGALVAFVVSLNLHRRHLSESQRGMVAAKLANMPAHRPDNKAANLRTSQAEAAKLLNVSERTVNAAAKVKDEGATELVQAAEMAERGITVAPTPPQYCDLCGVEDDCLLMLDAPGYPDDLVDCCGSCEGSRALLQAAQMHIGG